MSSQEKRANRINGNPADNLPRSGKPINKEYSTQYKGKTVYFCCPNCKPEFEKNPEKYVGKLPQFQGSGV